MSDLKIKSVSSNRILVCLCYVNLKSSEACGLINHLSELTCE